MASPVDNLHPDIRRIKGDGQQAEDKNQHVEKEGGLSGGERDMAPVTGNSIHRSGSRPQLDLSKAAIQGNFEERDPTILLPNQSDDISHLALDIGGIFHVYSCNLDWFILCIGLFLPPFLFLKAYFWLILFLG